MKKGSFLATSSRSSGLLRTAFHTVSECHSSKKGLRQLAFVRPIQYQEGTGKEAYSRSLSMRSKRMARSIVLPGE